MEGGTSTVTATVPLIRPVLLDLMLVGPVLLDLMLVGPVLLDLMLVGPVLLDLMLVGPVLLDLMLVGPVLLDLMLVGPVLLDLMLVGPVLLDLMLVGPVLLDLMLVGLARTRAPAGLARTRAPAGLARAIDVYLYHCPRDDQVVGAVVRNNGTNVNSCIVRRDRAWGSIHYGVAEICHHHEPARHNRVVVAAVRDLGARLRVLVARWNPVRGRVDGHAIVD